MVRLTTRRMMVAIAACALAAGTARQVAGTWGAGELMTLVVIVLGVSVLCALLGRGRHRGFWLGFCLFGWGYLALSQGWTSPSMADFLPTTRWLDAVFTRLGSAPQTTSDRFDAALLSQERAARFRAGGHAVLGLLFAAIGGLGGYILAGLKRPTEPEPGPPDGSLLRDFWVPE
jgi:hypothetical protein